VLVLKLLLDWTSCLLSCINTALSKNDEWSISCSYSSCILINFIFAYITHASALFVLLVFVFCGWLCLCLTLGYLLECVEFKVEWLSLSWNCHLLSYTKKYGAYDHDVTTVCGVPVSNIPLDNWHVTDCCYGYKSVQFVHFMSAIVFIQFIVLTSTSWSDCMPPSNSVNGHVSSIFTGSWLALLYVC